MPARFITNHFFKKIVHNKYSERTMMSNKYEKNNATFYEVQRDKIIIPLVACLSSFIFIFENKRHHIFSELPTLTIIAWLAVPLLIIVLVYFTSLKTIINYEGIYVKTFPFHRRYKYFAWSEIQKAYIRKYRPLVEYGGWGYRFNLFKYKLSFITRIRYWGYSRKLLNSQKNRAITVSGNKGLQLEFTDGSKLLIGTHKPEYLTEILKKLGKFHES
jgi:hypothetical protein